MEKWDGDVLDINENVEQLGPRYCSQLLGLQYSVVPIQKRKDIGTQAPGDRHTRSRSSARTAWRDPRSAQGDSFFLPLYGQKSCSTMNDTCARLFHSRKKPPPLKKLLLTDVNLLLHVLRAHLQMLLWKAADQHDPPEEAQDIGNFDWTIKGSTIALTVSTAPVAPQALLDVVSCSCTTEGKACSGARCSCNSAGLSCTDYCKCEGGVACYSHFTIKQMNIEDKLSGNDDDEEQ